MKHGAFIYGPILIQSFALIRTRRTCENNFLQVLPQVATTKNAYSGRLKNYPVHYLPDTRKHKNL